mmetsp:Transcript_131296/g.365979  ORF Transcript_131296/g.365979 Transcript_131296/m.365979 type:complete len:222 (+) Transcript_131296:1053-1718(+)
MPRMDFSSSAQLGSGFSWRDLIIELVHAPPAPPGPASAGSPKDAVLCTSAEVWSSLQPLNMMTFEGMTSLARCWKACGSLGPLPGPNPLMARACRSNAFFCLAAKAVSSFAFAQHHRAADSKSSVVRFQSPVETFPGLAHAFVKAAFLSSRPSSSMISAAAILPAVKAMSLRVSQAPSLRTPMPFNSPRLSSTSACCDSSPVARRPPSWAMDCTSAANAGG